MSRVQNGETVAFRQLYDRYKVQLFLYCLRMVNDRDAAKDVLQDVFIRIHTRREQYRAGTNFPGWIHTIARNLCLNARRDARDHQSYDESMPYASAEVSTSDVVLRQRLAEEIARLPALYRDALVLREYEDLSYQEIADALSATMATVKFRIFKAREMLRTRLGSSLDEYNGGSSSNNNQE
ncbi:MAG: sigma-70 family RNA polymerase sigma factor [bacterium]|nr:sigma-70 family RNA polymerase sigma factor [Candidatus Kapabacteria bacterium]